MFDIIQELRSLPPIIEIDGRQFVLEFFYNHNYDWRLCYKLWCDDGEYPLPSIGIDHAVNWCFLYENITTEKGLHKAIVDARNFLWKHRKSIECDWQTYEDVVIPLKKSENQEIISLLKEIKELLLDKKKDSDPDNDKNLFINKK